MSHLLGPTFIAQTICQVAAGVEFTIGEMIGPIGGFGTVAILASWVLVTLLRTIEES